MKKDLTEKKVLGMTVNERLYHTGLLNEFDEAISQKNIPKLKFVLKKLYFSSKDIQDMIEQLLN